MKMDEFQSCFSLFSDTEAKILQKSGYDDYENTYVLTEIGTVKGDMQPYGGGLAQKEYGLSVDCEYSFYCQPCSDIKEGVYLSINEKTYKVQYAAPWLLGIAALLKEVDISGRREQ